MAETEPSRSEGETEIIQVEQSVEIKRPVEEVFDFVADFENWPDMHPSLRDGGESSGPVKEGETFLQTLDVPGQKVELLCEVVGYEPNEQLSLKYTWSNLRLDVSFLFEAADGHTTLTGKGEGRMSGFFRLLEPWVNEEINREVATNLDNLKKRLESRNSDDAGG